MTAYAEPQAGELIEIISMRPGKQYGWQTKHGDETAVNTLLVSFRVHADELDLTSMYVYLYDSQGGIFPGCGSNKVSAFTYKGEYHGRPNMRHGGVFKKGVHNVMFYWSDKGRNIAYYVCVLGNNNYMAADLTPKDFEMSLMDFNFDEKELLQPGTN